MDAAQALPLYIVEQPAGAARTGAVMEILAAFAGRRPASVVLEGALAGDVEIDQRADIRVHRLAYGCPCCAGSLPLIVTLGRILRHERPSLLVLAVLPGAHRTTLEGLLREKFGDLIEIGVFCHKPADVARGLLNPH